MKQGGQRSWFSGPAAGYAVAVVGTGAAALVRWVVDEVVSGVPPFITFYPVAILAAAVGGTGPGLLATFLTALVATYCFIEPKGQLVIASTSDTISLVIFALINIAISLLGGRLRRAHQTTQAASDQLNAIISNMTDALVVSDLKGNILNFNPAALRLHGFSTLEEVNKTLAEFRQLFEITDLNGQPMPFEAWPLSRAIRGETFTDHEIQIRRRDTGQEFIGSYSGAIVPGQNHGPTLAVVTIRDITRLKRAEEANAKLAAIVENCDDAILSITLDGVITSWNAAAEQLFGYSAAEIIGRPIPLLVPADHQDDETIFLERLRSGQRVKQYETVRLTRDGRRIDALVTISPIRNAAGQLTGASKIIHDITHRRRAEEAFRQSQERLGLAMLAAKLGTWDWNIATGELDWSPRCLELYGLSPDTRITYERFLETVYSKDRNRIDQAVQAALEQHGDYDVEIRIPWRDGTFHWVASRGRGYYNSSGQATRMSGVALDITERKQTEEALRRVRANLALANADLEQKVRERTTKLQETVAELEQFSHTITHDMRAPLRAMRGLGGILLEECTDCLTPVRREYLRRIAESAERMDKLITDALQYSGAIRQHFELEPVDTGDLLRGILESYPQFQSPHANIHIDNDLPTVLGNKAALIQCFSNLLGNAVKFVQPGQAPEVRVWAENRSQESEVRDQRAEGRSQQAFVRIWFEDKGIGIEKEYQDKIWGMFQRLNKSYEGTGIGLALVRKVVDRMGGKVGAESEPGRGSRFWVELKRSSGHPQPALSYHATHHE